MTTSLVSLIDLRDRYTGGHSARVARYVRQIAVQMCLPDEDTETVVFAASLHDIGKIGVPDHVLLKPGELAASEFAWIRKHPEVGSLRIMILSGSELRDDIQRAYAGGADSYLVKPIGFKALMEVVKSIDDACAGGPASRTGVLRVCDARRQLQDSIDWFNGPGTAGTRA